MMESARSMTTAQRQSAVVQLVDKLKDPTASPISRDAALDQLTLRISDHFVMGCIVRAYAETLPPQSIEREAITIFGRSFGDAETDLALHANLELLESLGGSTGQGAVAATRRLLTPDLDLGSITFGVMLDALRALV